MSDVCFDDDDGDEPERNAKGQWVPGVSGNPAGRPPKPILPPMSLAEEFAEAFSQQVTIKKADGSSKIVSFKSALIQKLVAEIGNCSAKEMLYIIERLDKLGVFQSLWGMESEKHDAARDAEDEAFRSLIRNIRKAMDDE